MPIIVNLDVIMAKRKISLNELSERVDLTLSNLSILKTGKAKAIRLSTLEAICKALDCQPGDMLEYVSGNKQDAVRLHLQLIQIATRPCIIRHFRSFDVPRCIMPAGVPWVISIRCSSDNFSDIRFYFLCVN